MDGLNAFFKGFHYALEGLKESVKERNMKFHIVAAIVAVVFAFFLQFNYIKWCILLVVIGSVISFELINTAIEKAIDLYTMEKHPLAKKAKDLAAAAVLAYSFIAIIVGLILFLPPLYRLLMN